MCVCVCDNDPPNHKDIDCMHLVYSTMYSMIITDIQFFVWIDKVWYQNGKESLLFDDKQQNHDIVYLFSWLNQCL